MRLSSNVLLALSCTSNVHCVYVCVCVCICVSNPFSRPPVLFKYNGDIHKEYTISQILLQAFESCVLILGKKNSMLTLLKFYIVKHLFVVHIYSWLLVFFRSPKEMSTQHTKKRCYRWYGNDLQATGLSTTSNLSIVR